MQIRLLLLILSCALIGACVAADDGPLDVAIIGNEEAAFTDGLMLDPAAQHVRAATSVGLVVRDEAGLVAPGLANRWIVTDDGRSYVFRLRDGDWPDGRPLTAESVRRQLESRLKALEGTTLGLDLSPIDEVRTMAERVIEFRLSVPMPYLLELLAQPELAITPTDEKSIPMQLVRINERESLDLASPERRGLPMVENWQDWVRRVELRVLPAREAVDEFNNGDVDLVLGGSAVDFSMAEVGALSRATVRLDPAIGLFGLHVRRGEGVLAAASTREALSLAIDRQALVGALNIGGWVASNRVVPVGLMGEEDPRQERWQDLSIEERRAVASQRIAAASGGAAPTLAVWLPQDASGILIFEELQRQLTQIGVTLTQAEDRASADLVWRDRIARFRGARWFLNQFNCSLGQGLCSTATDARMNEYLATGDQTAREEILLGAVSEFESEHVFIPFGAPIRWSLVRSNVTGFEPNSWAFHPLPGLAEIPK